MKMLRFLLFSGAIFLLLVPISSQQKDDLANPPWCTIKPLTTSLGDLKNLFGSPMKTDESVNIYDSERFRVTIWFPNQSNKSKCDWNVSKTTVVKALIVPKRLLRVSSLNLDLSNFEKKEGSEDGFWDYTKKDLGFRVNSYVDSSGIEHVEFIDLSPRQTDTERACKN